jgi:Peptidase family M23
MIKTPTRAASLAALTATAILASTAAADAAPKLRMPFKCGQKVYGQARADHSPPNSIDFNGLGGGNTDLGMPVVAAARGKVTISTYYKSNGYGNAIQVSHGNGYATFYAHLRDRKVSVGQHVKRGQLIGHVGHSSAIYTFTAHLHYEERLDGHAIQARFNGGLAAPYRHMEQSVVMKSGNCKKKSAGSPNPNPPAPQPQPQPQPDPQPATDTTAPVVKSCGKVKQRFAKQKGVLVCVKSSEDGIATVRGKLKLRGVRKAIKLRAKSAPVRSGTGRTIRLRFASQSNAGKLLRRHRATALVTIDVRDAAGNSSRLKRTLKAHA